MWKRTKSYLIVVSVTLNVAFVAVWIAYAVPSQAHPEETGQRGTQHTIWCPLHRELGVTEEQWAQIEPRLREFQAAVAELRQQTGVKRSEVIDLIAAEEPDRATIRAKQDEILATKRSIQGLVAEHLLAEKQILTPDQQAKVFEMLRNRTSCADGPPMSGRPGTGLGPVLQNPDEG
ncbi:MAG: periplasmic heavy metal sensor [Planctomycetes bacterium]|nr:periplasmic heavy metal sensor [Planctomycetota bacterium]MBL7044187.1 periplasmic heavy metal sensor [Pirellulaceae bacterium]